MRHPTYNMQKGKAKKLSSSISSKYWRVPNDIIYDKNEISLMKPF